MERLVNCGIMLNIKHIEKISGGDQEFEIVFITQNNEKYKLLFDFVLDMRYSIENGYLIRFSEFVRAVEQESSVLLVENSKYIKYFENQVCGTRPTEALKNYIIYDSIDTVIEILTSQEPILQKI